MRLSGTSPDGRLVEAMELPEHRSLWRSSTTPNSRAAPTAPIHCFGNLCGRAWRDKTPKCRPLRQKALPCAFLQLEHCAFS